MCVRETLGERRDWTYRPNQDVIVHQDKTLSFFCFLAQKIVFCFCSEPKKSAKQKQNIITRLRWLSSPLTVMCPLDGCALCSENSTNSTAPVVSSVHRLSPALLLQSANRTNHQRMRLFGGELIFQTTFSTPVVCLLDLNHSALFRHKNYNHNSHASLQRPSQRFPKTK